jgi:predicted ribosomally synthesized peptide with nif11-like leader
MALEDVKAFYDKLANDETFYKQLQATNSKTECKKIVKDAGYNFTQQEFEEYTSHLLIANTFNDEIRDINKQELTAVLGGASLFTRSAEPLPPYGHPPYPMDIHH